MSLISKLTVTPLLYACGALALLCTYVVAFPIAKLVVSRQPWYAKAAADLKSKGRTSIGGWTSRSISVLLALIRSPILSDGVQPQSHQLQVTVAIDPVMSRTRATSMFRDERSTSEWAPTGR